MPRFNLELWDTFGYIKQRILDNATDIRVTRELHGEYTLSFKFPVRDLRYREITFRKIIRLVDSSKSVPSSYISSFDASNKELILNDASDFNLGDFVIVYDAKAGFISHKTTAAVTSGAKKSINVDGIGSIIGNSYVRISDENNSETVKVLNVVSSTVFVADLANSYTVSAAITSPGISYIARVITKSGNAMRLSRFDVEPRTGGNGEVRKVNFTTFRVESITESREADGVWATISCNHVGYDLLDYNFFKDGRADVSYSINAKYANIDEEVDISTLLDDCLLRQVNGDNNPLFVNALVKGELLRRRITSGTVSVTQNNSLVEGAGVNWSYLSSGSAFYVEGDQNAYTVSSSTATSISLTSNVSRSTADGLKYLIIDKTIQEASDLIQPDKVEVTYNSEIVTGTATTWANGSVRSGGIFMVEDDDKEYIIKQVVSNTTLTLTELVERVSGNTLDYSIRADRRAISFSKVPSLREVLTELEQIWTDDRQDIWFEVNEDKSVDVFRKPRPDDLDPTSNLEIRYSYNLARNLRSIKRTFERSNIVNRIIPQGATSNWVNSESKISSAVSAVNIIGPWDIKLGTLITTSSTSTTFSSTTATDGTAWDLSGVDVGMVARASSSSAFIEAVNDAGDQITVDRWTQGTPTTGTAIEIYTYDLKYYRAGDPVQIYDNYYLISNISNATQVTATVDTATQYAIADDGGVQSDESAASQEATIDDMTLLPATPAVDDAYYFGATEQFRYITLDLTTKGDGVWTLAWEYYNGVTWTSLNDYMHSNYIVNFRSDLGRRLMGFNPPPDWATLTILGNSAYWVRARVSAYTSVTVQPLGGQMWLGYAGLSQENDLAGGLIQITGGNGRGQVRRIISNSPTVITISRKWDILPIGATAIASQNVGNSYVQGFGKRELSPSSAGSNYIDKYNIKLDNHAYIGGILRVLSGTGQGQTFAIADNKIGDWDSDGTTDDSRIYVDGTFVPQLDSTSRVEIIGRPLACEEVRADGISVITTFTANTVQVSPDPSWNTTGDNQWAGAKVIITNGDQIEVEGIVSSNTSDTLTMTGSWTTQPDDDSSFLIYFRNDLPLSLVSGLESASGKFNLTKGDKIVLLLKESGGPLTIGKHFSKRSNIINGTLEWVQVEEGDGGNFDEKDLLFIGAKEYTSSIDFYRRGDQSVGEVGEISSFSRSGSAILSSTAGNTTYTSTTVTDSTPWSIAQVKQKMIAYANDGGVEIEGTIIEIVSNTLTINSWYPRQPSDGVQCQIFNADKINFVGELETTPLPGDHVEALSLVDVSSIRGYGLIERGYEANDLNDPRQLLIKAESFISEYANLKPKYEIDFLSLYEYEPDNFIYDSYELGDTVRVIDDDLNIDVNLRVIREEYNPETRADVKVQVSSSILPITSSVRQEVESLERRMINVEASLEQRSMPKCVYFDSITRQCVRILPPNVFCNSSASKNDGKSSKMGEVITKAHCSAFMPEGLDVSMGTDTGVINTHYYSRLVNVTSFDWETDANHRFGIDLDYFIEKLSFPYKIEVKNNATGSDVAFTEVEVRIQIDDANNFVPYDDQTGLGCFVQARLASGAAIAAADVDIAVHIVGKYA